MKKWLVNGRGIKWYEAIDVEIEAEDEEEARGTAEMDFFHGLAYEDDYTIEDLTVELADED